MASLGETIEAILSEYDSKIVIYEEFRKASTFLLGKLIRLEDVRVHSVTSRLKERESLAAKLSRIGKSYSRLTDITDVVGVRVITHLEDEVDSIGLLVEREFAVDRARSIDKRKMLDPDRFGYLSLHYICNFSPERVRLPEYHRFEGLSFEIQVRSILQHAWAEIEHDLGYKGERYPALYVAGSLGSLACWRLPTQSSRVSAMNCEITRKPYRRRLTKRRAK